MLRCCTLLTGDVIVLYTFLAGDVIVLYTFLAGDVVHFLLVMHAEDCAVRCVLK